VLDDDQILIAGAVRAEDMGPGMPPRYYNSVYVVDGRGQIIGASDKVHLVPFGEYVPFESILDYLGIQNVVEMPGGFSPAASRSMLDLPNGVKFYPLICYEVIFPDEMTPDIVSANAILNVTNDAWFGDTPGPYQHLQQARVRAVEYGLPLIRSANTGISVVVDAHGRIISGIDLNAQGFFDATLSSTKSSTVDDNARKMYFWLIAGGAALIALISRMGFISRVN
jgi:apolipoprotein N-acyltransferase